MTESERRGPDVLWAANVRARSLEERLAIAQAGGFGGMSVFPSDKAMLAARPGGLLAAATQIADAGITEVILDPFARWVPSWAPPAALGAGDLAFLGMAADEFFEMAETLGARSMTVIEAFGQHFGEGEVTAAFAAICDRAAEHGLSVHIEFIPGHGVASLADAWALVSAADRPNGGIVFDVWHYLRGERDDELLQSIDGDRILRVQLADGLRELVGSLDEDMLHHRLAPGRGELDVAATVRRLAGIGGLSSVGPEIFSDALDARPADEVASFLRESTDAVLGPRTTGSR